MLIKNRLKIITGITHRKQYDFHNVESVCTIVNPETLQNTIKVVTKTYGKPFDVILIPVIENYEEYKWY